LAQPPAIGPARKEGKQHGTGTYVARLRRNDGGLAGVSVFDMSLKRDKRNINKRDGLLATKTGVFQKQ